jgi:Resolvase, N terminal domain
VIGDTTAAPKDSQNRRLGYARVSTYGQTLDAQLEQLRAEGCSRIYREKVTGAHSDRRELLKLLKGLAPGDVVTDRSSARSKRRHLFQQLSRRCLLLAHLRKVRGSLRRHRHLLGEFRPGGEFLKPRSHVWVQLGERIAGKRQPVSIDEPGNIENRQLVAEQVRLGTTKSPMSSVIVPRSGVMR